MNYQEQAMKDFAAIFTGLVSALAGSADGAWRIGASLVILACAFFLSRSIKRHRDEVARRLAECEDAHLSRDKIQLDLVQLVAKQGMYLRQSTGGRRGGDVQARDMEAEFDKIVSSIHKLNDDVLTRRSAERVKQDKAMQIEVPKLFGGS